MTFARCHHHTARTKAFSVAAAALSALPIMVPVIVSQFPTEATRSAPSGSSPAAQVLSFA